VPSSEYAQSSPYTALSKHYGSPGSKDEKEPQRAAPPAPWERERAQRVSMVFVPKPELESRCTKIVLPTAATSDSSNCVS